MRKLATVFSLAVMAAAMSIPIASTAANAQDGCDPNYSGCVPIDSDVDCASGGGNGPSYINYPVTVTGEDIYELDADGDGTGCDDETGLPPSSGPECGLETEQLVPGIPGSPPCLPDAQTPATTPTAPAAPAVQSTPRFTG